MTVVSSSCDTKPDCENLKASPTSVQYEISLQTESLAVPATQRSALQLCDSSRQAPMPNKLRLEVWDAG